MIIKKVDKPPTWVRVASMNNVGEDVVKSADLMLENAMRPKLEEPAIVHPFNTSTIKIRNNGMIDMFVGTDQGIRLDPYSKTLNEIVDGLKWHVGYFKGWIDKDAEWYANNNILFDAKASVSINAKSDVSIKSGKNITIECDGKLTLNANGGIAINTSGDVSIGGKALEIASDGDVVMGGRTVQLGTKGSNKSKAKKSTRESSSCDCPTTGTISTGSPTVFIDGLPAARLGDEVSL